MRKNDLYWSRGIYLLSVTGRSPYYLGSTNDSFYERISSHYRDFKVGRHHSNILQKEYVGPGLMHAFVLEETCTPKETRVAESFWLKQLNDKICNRHLKGGTGLSKTLPSRKPVNLIQIRNTVDNRRYLTSSKDDCQAIIGKLSAGLIRNEDLRNDVLHLGIGAFEASLLETIPYNESRRVYYEHCSRLTDGDYTSPAIDFAIEKLSDIASL